MVGRTAYRAGQKTGNAFLKNLVLRQTDRIEETLTFQNLIDVRGGEGGVPSEVAAQVPFPVTLNDGIQNAAPIVRTQYCGGPGKSDRVLRCIPPFDGGV
jgi:hypothetical protein